MKDRLKHLVLVNGFLTIIAGVLMILDGFDVIRMDKPMRIAMAVVLCINAAVNCLNYRRVLKQQKASWREDS